MSSRATSTDTTSSSVRSFMPRTPAAVRPIGRTSSSLKRIVMPLRLTMKMSSPPPVSMTLHQLVAVAEVEGDEAVAPARVVGVERRLLDRALAGGEEQEALAGEVAGVDDRLDLLARLQRQQVDDRHALRRALALGDLQRPQAVHLAEVGEEQQVGVGRGEDHVAHDVVGLQLGRRRRRGRRGACVLNEPAGTALTYCASVMTTTSSLSSTRSSIDISPVVEGDLAHPRRGELLLDRPAARP